MSSLTGNPIANTYQALIKLADNTSGGVNLENLTDGLGNPLALSLSQNQATIDGILSVVGPSQVTGSLTVTGGVTGSFKGNVTGTATTASYVNVLNQDVSITGELSVTDTLSALNGITVNNGSIIASTGNIGAEGGNLYTTYGKIGVKNSNPTYDLDVNGTAGITGSLIITGSITQGAYTASFGGKVGIGTTSPTANLDISGSTKITINTPGVNNTALTVNNTSITTPQDPESELLGTGIYGSGGTGVYGNSDAGYGVRGVTNGGTGVWGESADANAEGVRGTATSNGSIGVYAIGYMGLRVSGSNVAIEATGPVNITGSITQGAYTASFGGKVGIGTKTPTTTLDVIGNVKATSFTGSFSGSLAGTASFATTASFAISASTALLAPNYVLTSITSSMSVATASYVLQAVSASFASTASSVNPLIQTVQLTGSLKIQGSATGSFTGSFTGDGSQLTGISASIQTSGSSLYSFNPVTSGFSTTHSIFLGSSAGISATNAISSNFLGRFAGYQATNGQYSNFLGQEAGRDATDAEYSNFLGYNAGRFGSSVKNSNFLGQSAGQSATNAANSNFLGELAGYFATDANFSNFLGENAGRRATSASYSTLIGHQAGYNVAGGALGVKSNNIIIGTNITLPDGAQDSINLGGVIFATGSYSTTGGNPSSAAVATGRVGIGIVTPKYTLDVSGSGNYSNGATVTGSLSVTGSTTINNLLTLVPTTTTPGVGTYATGSIIMSGSSGADINLYVFTGAGAAAGWAKITTS